MASLAGYFNFQQITSSGDPANGYRMYTYAAGTTTHRAIYTDPAGLVPHTYSSDGIGGQYIALNERGELPAPIFLASGGYDIALKTSAGATVWTRRAYGSDDSSSTLDAALRADLANEASATKGAGMIELAPTTAYAVATLGGWLRDSVISANAYTGIDPTGAADSAVAIETLLNLLPNGSVVRFRGTYKCNAQAINIQSKSLTIDARGATFNFAGDSRGFKVTGVVPWFEVNGGTYVGDGVNRDASYPDGEIPLKLWNIGNASGAQVSNVVLSHLVLRSANVGICLADGRGGGGTKTTNCRIIACHASNMVGAAGGRGYGYQMTQADGSTISDSVADTCGRHGFYIGEGRSYSFNNIRTRNCGDGSSPRGALAIARCAHVTVDGYIAENNVDVGMIIDTNLEGLPPDNICKNIRVTNYLAVGNTLGDVIIGTTNVPGTDGFPVDVTIEMQAQPSASATSSSVVIGSGKNLRINADIVGGTGSSYRAFTFRADGGAAYTDNVYIGGRWSSGGYCVQIPASIQTGTVNIRLNPDMCVAGVASYEFLGGADATTNPNLRYNFTGGAKPTRTVTTTGTGQTPNVGGFGVIRLAPGSASEYTNFTGLADGEEVIVIADNNNVTLKQSSSLLLDGSADVSMTSADVVILRKVGAALRQISKVVAL